MLQSASTWWYGAEAQHSANDTNPNNNDNTVDNDENKEDEQDEAKTMLQSASNWWYGTEIPNPPDPNKDEDEKVDIEFEKELNSISCLDPVLSIFKLIDFKTAIKNMLLKQFNDDLAQQEHTGIIQLFDTILAEGVHTKSQLNVYSELKIGDIILSYFASISPTNPDAIGCWNRWIEYRMNKDIRMQLSNVEHKDLEKFYDTCSNEFGYDNKGRLIWFVSTEKYDGYIDDNTQRKGYMLLLMSFLWDLKTNTFELKELRHGVQSHLNLSNFTYNLASWSTVYAVKDCLVAFPYSLKDIYILNPPMLVYLVKTVAANVFTAHSLDKFVFLNDLEHYFKDYGSKDKTPAICGGTQELTVSQWVKQRGYL